MPLDLRGRGFRQGGRRQGREQVADYFRQFAATSRFHPMQDVVFTAAGDRVVAERPQP